MGRPQGNPLGLNAKERAPARTPWRAIVSRATTRHGAATARPRPRPWPRRKTAARATARRARP
eukprot:3396380-Lingulodinium_polyedra.AAC.1